MSRSGKNQVGSIRPGVLLGLYAVFVITALATYLSSFPIPDLRPKILALFSATFLIFSFHSLGKIITRKTFSRMVSEIKLKKPSFFQVSLNISLGLGIISLLVLILGWLFPGSLSIKLLFVSIFLLVASLLGIKNLWLENKFFVSQGFFSLSDSILIFLSMGGIAIGLLSCFSPITYYDSLVYHLALPALYNNQGAITAVPFNLYSFFPGNMEMIYLYILNQFPEPEYVINLLGLAISLCASLVVAEWVSDQTGKRGGILALALWWTMPAVLLLSTGAYVDVALGFFILLSIRSFSFFMRNQRETSWFVLSGLFGGLAFATKYTGAICLIILGSYLLVIWISRKGSFSFSLWFAASGLIFPCLWLIKNWFFVGNPVFPFLFDWFGGDVGWTKETASRYFAMLTEYGAKSNVFFELLLSPWKIINSSLSFGGGFDVLGDFGWFLILFGAPLGFFFFKKEKIIRFISIYVLAHFSLWFITKPVLRFLLGAMPLLLVLSAIGIQHLMENKNPFTRIVTKSILIFAFLSNFFIYFSVADVIQPFTVSIGNESREDNLSRRLPHYGVFKSINTTLNQKNKLLLLGEQRTYHLNIPFVCSNLFARSAYVDIFETKSDINQISTQFKNLGITHILINEKEIDRLGGFSSFGFSNNGLVTLRNFLSKNSTLTLNYKGIDLYEIQNL